MDKEETELRRFVKPVGNLLNDNDSGIDQLGYLVYAQALAKLLHNCRPPITVGLFAPWGSGKTFLLKHVQGLLRKYERQNQYDVINLESVGAKIGREKKESTAAERDEEISESLASKRPKNKTRKTNNRRCCTYVGCTLACVLVIAMLCAGLLLLFLPIGRSYESVYLNTTSGVAAVKLHPVGKSGNVEKTINRSASLVTVVPTKTTKPNYTATMGNHLATTAVTDDNVIIASNIRLYLVLTLVVVTAMLFVVFCCCISNTSSKCWSRFTEHFSVVMYAAFTRLPSVTVSSSNAWIEADNPYMVVSLNDDDAKLRAFDPSDEENFEGFHLSADQVNSMRIKYIFVNYHAWQYAGSDTLWAGIVTNLSDAIEEEFGSVSPRLFRMMQVERPSKSGPIKASLHKKEDPRAIYVRFYFPMNDPLTNNLSGQYRRVASLMREYGVVTRCCHVINDQEDETHSWWFARFSTDKEASFAETALEIDNFEVRRVSPCAESAKAKTEGLEDKHKTAKSNNMEMKQKSNRANRNHAPDLVVEERRGGEGEKPLAYDTVDAQGAREPLVESNDGQASTSLQKVQSPESHCCNSGCCRCFSHFRNHPKTVCCGCPYLYCCILFVAASLVFPIAIAILASDLELGVLKSTRSIPVEVQVFSWLPASLGVIVIAARFCWAMCHSQTVRIQKALAGAAGNMASGLGFMNDVKTEVMIMTQLINCIRFTHRINYKVVITIDDLDRCPTDKVKSVLEAVSILLSDRSSPFICIVAVDSRVAVKCIEQDMGEGLLQANLSGHEYLKKIINLPFCLPEVADKSKKKYLAGLMDIADKAKLKRVNVDKPPHEANNLMPQPKRDVLDTGDDGDAQAGKDGQDGASVTTDSNSVVDGAGGATPDVGRKDEEKREQEQFDDNFNFLLYCREFLYNNKKIQRHMCGNPRNIKRIFNVLSLTTHMLQCIEEKRQHKTWLAVHSEREAPRDVVCSHRESIMNSNLDTGLCFGKTKEDAEDLVCWIVLTDQWPYRMSYILQVIEDSDQRRDAGMEGPNLEEGCTFSDIYEEYVEPEIASNDDAAARSMLVLDADPAILRSLLRECKNLTRRRASLLFPVTMNLDQSIRNGISRQRCGPKPPSNDESNTAHVTANASRSNDNSDQENQ